jgi:hypothetical protein
VETRGPVALVWEVSKRYPDAEPEVAVWTIPRGAALYIDESDDADGEGFSVCHVAVEWDADDDAATATVREAWRDCDGPGSSERRYVWSPSLGDWEEASRRYRDVYAEWMGY